MSLGRAFFGACILLVTGCQSKPRPVKPPPEESFRITLAGGGGFTGAVKGCTLGSDGTARFWWKLGDRDSTTGEARGSVERVIGFRAGLSGALALDWRKAGNMTTSVRLELSDTAYAWSWPGTGVDDSTPEPFKTWYPEVRAYCDTLERARK